jgi:hypothetical protein
MRYAAIAVMTVLCLMTAGCFNYYVQVPDRKQEIFDQCSEAVNGPASSAILSRIIQDWANKVEVWVYHVDNYAGIRDSYCLGVRDYNEKLIQQTRQTLRTVKPWLQQQSEQKLQRETYWSLRHQTTFKSWFLLPSEHKIIGVFKAQNRWYMPCGQAGNPGVETDRVVLTFDPVKTEFRIGSFTEINRRELFDYAETSLNSKPRPAGNECGEAIRAPAYAGKLDVVFRDTETPTEIWLYHVGKYLSVDNSFCLGVRQNDGSVPRRKYMEKQYAMKFSSWYLLPARWKPIGVFGTEGVMFIPCLKDRAYDEHGITLVFYPETETFYLTPFTQVNQEAREMQFIRLES